MSPETDESFRQARATWEAFDLAVLSVRQRCTRYAIRDEQQISDLVARLANLREYFGAIDIDDRMKRLDPSSLIELKAIFVVSEALAGNTERAKELLRDAGKRYTDKAAGILTEFYLFHIGPLLLRGESFKTLIAEMRQRAGRVKSVEAPLKPTVTLGDHSHVMIDGVPIPLQPDAAAWLKVLIDHGDWLSDGEYIREHGSENDRPDRWRKKLPPEVKSRIETNIKKGSRWKLA